MTLLNGWADTANTLQTDQIPLTLFTSFQSNWAWHRLYTLSNWTWHRLHTFSNWTWHRLQLFETEQILNQHCFNAVWIIQPRQHTQSQFKLSRYPELFIPPRGKKVCQMARIAPDSYFQNLVMSAGGPGERRFGKLKLRSLPRPTGSFVSVSGVCWNDKGPKKKVWWVIPRRADLERVYFMRR